MGRGAFIVLEGLDRSGKSTQASLLVEYLKKKGKSVESVRFPDRDEPFGRVISAYLKKEVDIVSPQALHLAFSLNRWQKADFIRQSIEKGSYVVCDRYCYSGIAYSIANGLEENWVKQADCGLPRPDIVLFFDVDEKVAERRGGYGDERLESKEIQAKVKVQMRALADETWTLIDANSDTDTVSSIVFAVIDNVCPTGSLSTISFPSV